MSLPVILPFSDMRPRPPPAPLFPYTTLFRSRVGLTPRDRYGSRVFHDRQRWKQDHSPYRRLRGNSRRGEVLHRPDRSEEHTSELQSRGHLVCRLLLEKKNKLLNIRQSSNPAS